MTKIASPNNPFIRVSGGGYVLCLFVTEIVLKKDQWSYIKSGQKENATMSHKAHSVKKLCVLLLPLSNTHATPFGMLMLVLSNQSRPSKQDQAMLCPAEGY
ncbi:hypothetical protein BCR42DRAFT_389809 [Absidia repens]|uniref:Uncharacterized protein n=1 Tax=Absidia repens TaxID=90262 RepID=A0A1X2IQS5_9FUNG|nr:hypothetical protein BCR42DRAFT_389809 [Absidia repens]